MILIIILLIFLSSSFFEMRSLWEKKAKKEVYISTSFLLIGTILTIMSFLNVRIPSPFVLIEPIFGPVAEFMTNLLT